MREFLIFEIKFIIRYRSVSLDEKMATCHSLMTILRSDVKEEKMKLSQLFRLKSTFTCALR